MRQAIETRYLFKILVLCGFVVGLTLFMFNGQSLTAKATTHTAISTNKTLADGDYISGTISGCTITIPAGTTVTVTGQITISGTVNMVGGGKLVRSSSFVNASMIKVSSGAVLNIGTASGTTGITLDGGDINVIANGGGIYCGGGTVNLYSGANVTNHSVIYKDNSSTNTSFGGGIFIESGTLNMFDGALVTNNTTGSTSTTTCGGGGIVIWTNAVFNMSGGVISGNNSASKQPGGGGGGVYVYAGTFNMSGGTISGNNSGRNGGAVHIDGTGSKTHPPVMNMTGGLITGNSAVWGGGIEILADGGLVISGGKINSNTCTSGGGGIELDALGYLGYLKISGGAQITGNSKNGNQDNFYIDKNIEVIGNFTGSVGVTHESSSVNAIGGVFGTNTGSYTGMENFFCDGKELVGVLSGSTVKWKSSSATLTSVALSTNSPFKGKTITTTLTASSGSGEATYQWYRNTGSSNSGGTLIVGATESSYTPSIADVGGYLYVIANGTGGSTGKVVSAATAAVQWPSVATPSFGVAAGTYISTQNVTITCSTVGADIYYTTDGSTPTSGSTKYTGAITVASAQTIKAIAVKDEFYRDSVVVSAVYNFRSITATPYNGTYDGKAHEAASITGIVAGDTVTYSNNNVDFTDTCPKYTDANSYEVYVKVENLSQGTWISNKLTVHISRADGSITITGDSSKTYDGNDISDPTVTKNGSGTVTFNYYNDNSGSIGEKLTGAPSAVGTYWVKAVMAQDTNYNAAEATKKFSITAATHTITVQSGGNGTASANVASAISGSAITLSSEPASGYQLKEWQVVSGGIIITGNAFVMPDNNVTVKAVFEVIPVVTYQVTVDFGPGSGSGSGNYAIGATVNISADTPVSGKQFKGWSVVSGGVTLSSSTSALASFTMPGNTVEIEAVYEDIPPINYTITVQTGGNGTASANVASAISGSAITLSSEPASGYQLKEWQVVSGGIIITGNAFVMPDNNVTVKAVFEVIPVVTYPVTVNYGPGSGSGSGNYAIGAIVNISADTPVSGKQFKGWSVISGGVTLSSSTSTFTSFTMPGNTVEIEAAYEDIPPNSYTITIQSEGNGYASANVASAVSGTAITLNAVPTSGYRFKEWQVVSGGSIIIDNSFIMPENNVTIKAVFEVIPIIIPPIDVPPVIIPTDNSSQASPIAQEEKITVDVKSDESDTAAAVITMQKSKESDGKITASVTFEEDKAKETIDKLGQAGKNVARIVIPDDKKELSELKIEIPTDSLNLITASGINLEIDTDNGKIYVPNETLQETNSESKEDLYFRLVPIKDETEKAQVIERAKQEAVIKIMQDAAFSIVGTPVKIETNLPRKEAEIILPINNAEIPEASEAREEFLSKLAVYIEHSDGEKELVKGEIVEYSKGMLGIRFTITKFSSFSIIKSDSFVNKSNECEIITVKASTGIKQKGTELVASVENKTETLKLDLIISKSAVWKLYSNKACTNEISDNTINLSIGKNIVYIKITAEDGVTEKLYKLTVTRKDKAGSSSLEDNSSETKTKVIPLSEDDRKKVVKDSVNPGRKSVDTKKASTRVTDAKETDTKATDTRATDTRTKGTGKAPNTGTTSYTFLYACLACVAGSALLILRRMKKSS